MIKRECSNKILDTAFNDDPTLLNYFALASCIVGVKTKNGRKYPDISKSCRVLGLYEINDKKLKPNRHGRNVIATNINTNEVLEFKNAREASEFFGYNLATLRTYVNSPKRISKIWKLIYKD